MPVDLSGLVDLAKSGGKAAPAAALAAIGIYGGQNSKNFIEVHQFLVSLISVGAFLIGVLLLVFIAIFEILRK